MNCYLGVSVDELCFGINSKNQIGLFSAIIWILLFHKVVKKLV